MAYSPVCDGINAYSLFRCLYCKCLSQGSASAGSSHRLNTYSSFPHAVGITGLLQWFLMILQTFASLVFVTYMVCTSSIPGVKFLLSHDCDIPAALQDFPAVQKMFISQDNAPYVGCFRASSKKSTQYECSQAFHKLLGCISGPEIETQKTSGSGRPDFQLTSPQGPSANKNSHRRLSLKNAARNTWEITSGMVLILCYFTSHLCVAWSICCKFWGIQTVHIKYKCLCCGGLWKSSTLQQNCFWALIKICRIRQSTRAVNS